MNRLQLILLVLSTATFSPFVFSETTISPTKYEFYGQESKRHKSMLEVNNSSDWLCCTNLSLKAYSTI